MLQRAASNAYSWWVASHIRTKQSKWLEQSLQDMEEKVSFIVKLISEDGDSFAKRAEMYYKKRPELLNFVEESYRAYRALAERFDHISKELQNANNTLASAFPDQFQFAMEEDDDFGSSKPSGRRGMAYLNSAQKEKTNIPNVPKQFPTKNIKAIIAIAGKSNNAGQGPTKPGKRPGNKAVEALKSGFNKTEAIEEIDKLQKKILTKQTEKEFTKSAYESGVAKYWQIENEITEMQEKVSNLQDEFGVGKAIEDNDARTVMLEAALKSCQQKLVELQEKHDQSTLEAEEERKRIRSFQEKLRFFKGEEALSSENSETKPLRKVSKKEKNQVKSSDEVKSTKEIEMLRDKMKEQFDGDLSVSDMVEKIDELVNKVIGLESSLSSQTAKISRMKEESDKLESSVQILEEEKSNLSGGNSVLNEKLQEMEIKLKGLEELEISVEKKNDSLETQFTEASSNFETIAEKLPDLDVDGEIVVPETKPVASVSKKAEKKREKKTKDSKPEKTKKAEEDEPNWQKLFNEELEKEKALRDEYISVLKSYEEIKKRLDEIENKSEGSLTELNELKDSNAKKDEEIQSLREQLVQSDSTFESYEQVKKKLGEVENQSEDSIAELTELRDANAKKDEELQSLRERVLLHKNYSSVLENYEQVKKQLGEVEHKSEDSLEELKELRDANEKKDEEISLLRDKLVILQKKVEDYKNMKEAKDVDNRPQASGTDNDDYLLKMMHLEEPREMSPVESRLRADIDEILEENLDFWMRFSSSFAEIQKFHSQVEDLQQELAKIEERKPRRDSSDMGPSMKSDSRAIYKHLKEIQTDLTVWMERSMTLKEELQCRFSQLCHIQEQIKQALNDGAIHDEMQFTSYQAAKFQGEVLNMQQENNKVADELQASLDNVTTLQIEVERIVNKLNEELGITGSKAIQPHSGVPGDAVNKNQVPLRSFIFGVKPKKQKQSMFFSVPPSLHKKYQQLKS